MWPTTQNVRQSRIPSRTRSMIFGCGFIGGLGLLQFVDDSEDAIALFHGCIEHEPKLRRVFQNDALADQALDALSPALEFVEGAFLLVQVPQDAHKNRRGMQVRADVDVVYG